MVDYRIENARIEALSGGLDETIKYFRELKRGNLVERAFDVSCHFLAEYSGSEQSKIADMKSFVHTQDPYGLFQYLTSESPRFIEPFIYLHSTFLKAGLKRAKVIRTVEQKTELVANRLNFYGPNESISHLKGDLKKIRKEIKKKFPEVNFTFRSTQQGNLYKQHESLWNRITNGEEILYACEYQTNIRSHDNVRTILSVDQPDEKLNEIISNSSIQTDDSGRPLDELGESDEDIDEEDYFEGEKESIALEHRMYDEEETDPDDDIDMWTY